MPDNPSSELLARYLAGEASAAERVEIEAWAAASPEHAGELARLRTLTARRPAGRWDVDRAWSRVSPRLDQPATVVPLRRRMPLTLALAATILVALGVGLVWQLVRGPDAAPTVLVTGPGERRIHALPDGTRITLAPNTELRVDTDYGRGERRVDLTGEVWFEVVHDRARPFRVHAAGTITEDLGTEFVVRAVHGTGLVRVAVVSGSASLRRTDAPPDQTVTLQPADVAELRDTEAVASVRRGTALDAYVSWHQGRLTFDDATLDSVAVELARWYGVAVRVTTPAAGARRFSGPVPLDRLDEALDVLRAALGLVVERRADTVVFRGVE